jgi:hypothetical protein
MSDGGIVEGDGVAGDLLHQLVALARDHHHILRFRGCERLPDRLFPINLNL